MVESHSLVTMAVRVASGHTRLFPLGMAKNYKNLSVEEPAPQKIENMRGVPAP